MKEKYEEFNKGKKNKKKSPHKEKRSVEFKEDERNEENGNKWKVKYKIFSQEENAWLKDEYMQENRTRYEIVMV